VSTVRRLVEVACDLVALVPVLLCRAEDRAFGSKRMYVFFSQCFAMFPGDPGVWLRAAFYRGTLQGFGERVYVGFGALVSQRGAIIEDEVYIGAYAIVGLVRLGARSLVGTRVSLLSGGNQHTRTRNGGWTPFDGSQARRVEIGEDVWIGEGAIVMADVGRGALVGAGSVVTAPVAPDIVVAGNPSRFVRKLEGGSQQMEPVAAAVRSRA
jgi:acetyltransferase-like isoleucine patch superfamily enzyme